MVLPRIMSQRGVKGLQKIDSSGIFVGGQLFLSFRKEFHDLSNLARGMTPVLLMLVGVAPRSLWLRSSHQDENLYPETGRFETQVQDALLSSTSRIAELGSGTA